ncbi:MAG: 50S ribosomal protein L24 [Candidatus Krumholzibacteriaceae bacterium]
MKIKKNDLVKVISGNYRGLEGKVLKTFPSSDRVIVEKVHLIKRQLRKQRGQVQQGGIVEKEAPIHVSDVVLVCPKCGKPTRTGILILADGTKARQCKKCQEMLAEQE